MKRIASVWLMDWPITAWRSARRQGRAGPSARAAAAPPDRSTAAVARAAEPPFALVERTSAGLILHALTPAARARGLKLYQSHADACAMVPDLVSAPAELEPAARALRRLAGWMERFSPSVTLDPSPGGLEGLFVDLTGGQHLFGGEAAMARAMLTALEDLGVPARLGVADTPGAAWALARYGQAPLQIAPQGGARAALEGLPVAALRITPTATHLLNRFGLRRIGMLTGLPRAALARRFRDAEALSVLQRLDQALGVLAEPLTPVNAPAVYRVTRVFFEPITNPESVALEAETLCAELAAALEKDGMGARRLRLTGFRVDGRTTSIEVRLASGSRRAAHLMRLFRDKGFEHLDLGFGVDALALSAPVAEPLHARQTGAFGDAQQAQSAAQDALVDRLSARLGENAVLSPNLRESWIPEVAETLGPYGLRPEQVIAPPVGDRPILLFNPPEPMQAVAELPDGAPARFVWRKVSRRVTCASGPERLAPEWWKDADPEALTARLPDRSRDYYRIEDEVGGRYWVFRKGLYGVRDSVGLPDWWMHGLFG